MPAARPVDAAALTAARGDAMRAATGAGVHVETVETSAELARVVELIAAVWGTEAGADPLPSDVLRAVVHAGGSVFVARRGGAVAGAAVAFFCAPSTGAAYSLIAAAGASDTGVGFALKQAQRCWAVAQGLTTMVWTFDPLSSRNARFNLVKLGAVAAHYTVNFYGPMNDSLNRGDESDRFTATWDLTGRRAVEAARGRPAEVLGPDPAARRRPQHVAPDGGPLTVRGEDVLWCRVPTDAVALRRADPEMAHRWRTATRAVLAPALDAGLVATAMSRDGWYTLERTDVG